MDLGSRLPHQEQATGDQDHVFPRKRLAEDLKYRGRQLHDKRDSAQQAQAQHQRHADADTARLSSVLFGQFVGENRDKDQVIDAQHDFHDDQGGQCHPGGGAGGQL